MNIGVDIDGVLTNDDEYILDMLPPESEAERPPHGPTSRGTPSQWVPPSALHGQ